MLEVRFLNAFREHGVSWKAIRIASECAREFLGVEHPFSNKRFSDDLPTRWWPMPNSKRIVIDPTRAFGAPVVDKEGVLTRILAKSVSVEDSIEFVAAIYDVDPISVAEAVENEHSLTEG